MGVADQEIRAIGIRDTTASIQVDTQGNPLFNIPNGKVFRIDGISSTVVGLPADPVRFRMFLNNVLADSVLEATLDARAYTSPRKSPIYFRPGQKLIFLWDQLPGAMSFLCTATLLGELIDAR